MQGSTRSESPVISTNGSVDSVADKDSDVDGDTQETVYDCLELAVIHKRNRTGCLSHFVFRMTACYFLRILDLWRIRTHQTLSGNPRHNDSREIPSQNKLIIQRWILPMYGLTLPPLPTQKMFSS